MTIENIYNYMWISDTITSSGQPEKEEFRSIVDAGFNAVVNLAMTDSENAIPNEGAVVTGLGLKYHHIPVPFHSPGLHHLKRFLAVMESLRMEKVWVHCIANYRVSAFLFQYRRWKGFSGEEARKAILPAWEPDIIWRKFMLLPVDGIRP